MTWFKGARGPMSPAQVRDIGIRLADALAAAHAAGVLRIPVSGWRADVLPPTEAAFNSGSHVYRCVANVVTGDQSTSQFRR